MDNCEFEKYLVEYLAHELPEAKIIEIEKHLSICENCSNQLHEIQSVHQLLLKYERPLAPQKLVKQYRKKLKWMFAPTSNFLRFKEWTSNLWNFFFDPQPVWVRLVKATVLLLIGIFIGRLVDTGIKTDVSTPAQAEILNITYSPVELRLMNEYFVISEMLLLSILNSSNDSDLVNTELLLNQEIAQKLLNKTTYMHEKTRLLQNESLNLFLNRLEFLLIEISNLDKQEITKSFQELRQTIEETKLLHETQRAQESLAISLRQGI